LDSAVREYERAIAERGRLDDRIAQLRQTIGTLSKLCGLVPTVPLGLADACRMVLRNADEPLTPTAVRDRLTAAGLELDRYANPLAAIHTTLKRLAETGDVEILDTDPASRVAYVHRPRPAQPRPSTHKPARRGRE
jgi:hypothetical protein